MSFISNKVLIINYMEFKDVVKEIRSLHNLTQEEFARLINFSSSIVNKWENGKKGPSVEAVKRIAIVFEVSADYILGIKDY